MRGFIDAEKELHEECGVFGIFQNEDAARLTYYGLHALQHRGQEGCGIVSMDACGLHAYKGKGLISEVFDDRCLSQLTGCYAIGHVRYSTAGGNEIENVQPLVANLQKHKFAVCHNGQIVNAKELRLELEKQGCIFQGSSDSEIILHLIQKGTGTFLKRIKKAFQQLEGAFACLILCEEGIYAIRDHNGLRPLSYAVMKEGICISSESCAFDVIGAYDMEDVKPGEIVCVLHEGIIKTTYCDHVQNRMCAMEYIYFSRPDSVIDGINVHNARKLSGIYMAIQDYDDQDTKADIVIGVPDSSISAAIGYAQSSGLPFEIGLVKNRYIGRTFIQPTQAQRDRGVRMKLSAIEAIVKDKSVVMIDDSIVRGTTSKRIVRLLKEAGAREVHVRIASPAIRFPCFYGVDTSSYEELICARMDERALCEYIQADSLKFFTIEGLRKCLHEKSLCTACFDGRYVTSLFSYGQLKDSLHKCDENA